MFKRKISVKQNLKKMQQYLDLARTILARGVKTDDRTGTGTLAIPSYEYVCELEEENGIIKNYPLLTTKRMSLKSVFEELIWKLSGNTNIRYLVERENHIWTEWPFKKYLKANKQLDLLENMWKDEARTDYTDEWKAAKLEFEKMILKDDAFCEKWGEIGHTYGYQFRNFGEVRIRDIAAHTAGDLHECYVVLPSVVLSNGEVQERRKFYFDTDADTILISGKDQLLNTVEKIKNHPESRRIMITLWNPHDETEDRTLLPPCPFLYQFFANEEGVLHLKMVQRSCDTFLGVPYNTAQDALFLCMMAHVTGRKPGRFTHSFGDAHIYLNHIEQMKKQVTRIPHKLPSIKLNPEVKNILDFKWEDIELIDYEHDKGIKGAVSI
ncbi:thymidylate synthase [bacterium]|nr:thymidylate synthase [bacterium]